MATYVTELQSPRSSRSITGDASFERVFLFENVGAADTDAVLIADSHIPRIGDYGLTATGARVMVESVDCESDADTPKVRRVVVRYARHRRDFTESAHVERPTLAPPVISVQATSSTSFASKDAETGEPFLNSVGVPFDPGTLPQVDVTKYRIAVTRNEQTIPLATAFEFKDTINSVSWQLFDYVFPARTVRFCGLAAETQYDNEITYYRCTYTFDIEPDGYDVRLLDQGWSIIDQSNGLEENNYLVRVKDSEGNPSSEPTLLNGVGLLLRTGLPPVFLPKPPDPAWKLYKAKDFAGLGLPRG